MTWTRVVRAIGIWIVTLVLAAVCILVGVLKFTQAQAWDRHFARWGYPAIMRPIVGVAEVGSGLAVLAPPIAAYGALTMGGVMMGAVATHATHGETNRLPPPLVLLSLSVIVWVSRRGKALGLSRHSFENTSG